MPLTGKRMRVHILSIIETISAVSTSCETSVLWCLWEWSLTISLFYQKKAKKRFRPGSWTTDDDTINVGDVDRSNAVEDAIFDSTVSDDDKSSCADDVIGNTTVNIVADVYKTKAAVDVIGDSAIGDEDVVNVRADAVFV